MQHKICHVNLTGKSWRTCKMNRMHPHILWYLGSIQFLSLHKIIWQVKVVVVNSLDNKSCGGKGPYEELG